jgi:hypothetical protein
LQGRGKPRIEWEEHMRKLTRKKGNTLQEETRLAKDRKAFRIWLMQPDASKGDKGLEEEELLTISAH